MELTETEKKIFCKIALTIARKGHLTTNAITKFCFPKHKRHEGKELVKKFYKKGMLQKHRTDTYELSKIGLGLAIKYCSEFRWKYIK
ncbi:MAG: hypothetical protein ACE5KT_04365 [Methanosarcinales archaeon]